MMARDFFFFVTQARLLEISLSGEDNVLKICNTHAKIAASPSLRQHLVIIVPFVHLVGQTVAKDVCEEEGCWA